MTQENKYLVKDEVLEILKDYIDYNKEEYNNWRSKNFARKEEEWYTRPKITLVSPMDQVIFKKMEEKIDTWVKENPKITKRKEVIYQAAKPDELSHLEELALGMYLMDAYYAHNSYHEEDKKDLLAEIMTAEWIRAGETPRTRSEYIEKTRVWINLNEFWKEQKWEEFKQNYYVQSDFCHENNVESQSIKDIDSEDAFKNLLHEWSGNYIILFSANPVEHKCAHILLKRCQHKNFSYYRFINDNVLCTYEVATISDKLRILHVAPEITGSFTKRGSADCLRSTIANLLRGKTRLNIDLIVSMGVAYGINAENYNLGDVLVSDKIYSYETIKRTNNSLKIVDTDPYRPNLDNKLKSIVLKEKKTTAPNPISRSDWDFEIILGTMLSGGVVLSDAMEKNRICHTLKEQYEDPIGGEMEGSGLIYTLDNSNKRYQKIPCVIIKGICDWGALKNGWNIVAHKLIDEEKNNHIKDQINDQIKDSVQGMCCYNAFRTLLWYLYQQADENSEEEQRYSELLNELKEGFSYT